ncbi:hypothetical protein J4E90_004653 [Alternaria incomplexa]|uniref:uncharacterized protein n=1 Tax=Alternaria incomplexa TaxID=1187928 RepID=UPI00221EFA43|nr:uncharacterized protein J4E90_004653 [Alternaria incomplexa]KAI4914622.1 hypothetical protein J4E90_004653 [Alternaria incomplexa]
MSDTDPKTPNKTGASGAAWSEGEKIAYLIVLCENEGKIDAKIGNAPIPAGRSIISCKKLLVRLKEKHKDDIAKIKNGQAFGPLPTTTDATPEKPKAKATPKKRKSKVDLDANADVNGGDGGEAEGSPKKKAAPRGRKKKVEVKEEVKEEEGLEEEEVLEEEV